MKKGNLIIFILVLLFFAFSDKTKAQSCPSNTRYFSNYAILSGEVTDTGGDNNVQVWFEWGINSNLGNYTPIQNIYVSSLPYRFCYTLNFLQPCTTYYYRAAIRNSLGTSYGTIYSFTTHCYSSAPLTISCYASPNPANTNSLVNFYSSVSGGTGNYTYSWSGACFSSSSTCSRTFSNPGNYSVNLTVNSGSFFQSTSCSVNVVSPSQSSLQVNQPPVAIIAFTPEAIFPGTIVTFDASRSYDPDGQIAAYSWEINGKIVSNKISFNRALASGVYRIKLKVTDNQGASSEKEILINVGRTVYRTKTKVITKKINIPIKTASSRLVSLLLDRVYSVKICSQNELQFTLINNTSVNRKITLDVRGEANEWFNPKSKTFILKPYETLLFKWKVNVPCNIKERNYEVVFLITTPGGKYEFSTILEAKKESNFLSPLLAFIGGLLPPLNLLWILILIIFILNVYLWYRVFKKKENQVP